MRTEKDGEDEEAGKLTNYVRYPKNEENEGFTNEKDSRRITIPTLLSAFVLKNSRRKVRIFLKKKDCWKSNGTYCPFSV